VCGTIDFERALHQGCGLLGDGGPGVVVGPWRLARVPFSTSSLHLITPHAQACARLSPACSRKQTAAFSMLMRSTFWTTTSWTCCSTRQRWVRYVTDCSRARPHTTTHARTHSASTRQP
jgi:hypothetical protein